MTFQPPPPGSPPPPPPPGGTPPPPPPPGGYGPPPGPGGPGGYGPGPGSSGSGGFDPKSVNPLDWALVGIGAVLFIFSFFDYYTVDLGDFGSESFSAWHTSSGTFWGWLAMILGVAAAVIVALSLFAPTVKIPLAAYVLALFLFIASFVFYLINLAALDDPLGHGFSFWLSFVLVIAGAVLAVMRAQQTGTALPGPLANIPKIGK